MCPASDTAALSRRAGGSMGPDIRLPSVGVLSACSKGYSGSPRCGSELEGSAGSLGWLAAYWLGHIRRERQAAPFPWSGVHWARRNTIQDGRIRALISRHGRRRMGG